MESSEASACNSRQSPASFESNPPRRRGVPVGALLSPGRKAYFRQQAYAPTVRKPIRPYHPSTQPRVDKSMEAMRHVVKEKIHVLENKLAECQKELNLVTTENRTYKILLRRQENTLKQYEGSEASLPQVIQAHDEEMRVIKSTLQAEKRMVRELEHQLKVRDDQLMPLRGEREKLVKLCKGSNLDEREHLTAEVGRLTELLREREEKISVLSRRVMLESKNSRHELGVLEQKLREALRQLSEKHDECERLKQVVAEKHKFITDNARRFSGNRVYTYVNDADKRNADGSATTLVDGTSFPGLNAQMRNDPSNLWATKETLEAESRSSSVVTVLSSTPTQSSANPTLPNLHKTLTIKTTKKTVSDCQVVTLPHISINELAVRSEPPCEEVRAADSPRKERRKEAPQRSDARRSKGDVVSNDDSEKEDSLDDKRLKAERQRKRNMAENKRITGMCSLLITVRTDCPADGDTVPDSRMYRVVTMVESPELLRSQLGTEKGYLQLTRESLPSSEELYDGFGVDDTDGSSSVSDSSEASEDRESQMPNWDELDKMQLDDEEQAMLEMEESVKREKEKSLELKAKYDQLNRALKNSKKEGDPKMDTEQRAKLLAALKEIDGDSVSADSDPGQGRKRDATIFTTSNFKASPVPRLHLPTTAATPSSNSSATATSATSAASSISATAPRFPAPGSAIPSSATSGSLSYGPVSSTSVVFPHFTAPASATSASVTTTSVAPGSPSSSSANSNSASPTSATAGAGVSSPETSSPSASGNSRLPTSRRYRSRRVSSSPIAYVPKAWLPASPDPAPSSVASPPSHPASNHMAPNPVASNPVAPNHAAPNHMAPNPGASRSAAGRRTTYRVASNSTTTAAASNPGLSNSLASRVASNPMASNPVASSAASSSVAGGRSRGHTVDPSGQQLLIDLFGSRAVEKKSNAEDTIYHDSLGRRSINDRNNNNVPTTSNRL